MPVYRHEVSVRVNDFIHQAPRRCGFRMRVGGLKVDVKNVIATFEVEPPIDLDEIYNCFPDNSLYDDTIFHRGVIVLQVDDPKMSFLIYKTGKIICTGAKSIKSAKNSDKIFRKLTKEKDLELKIVKKPSINNIVSVANLEKELDLEKLVTRLGANRVEYEPEQFPGAIYRSKKSRATLLLFKSGKIVLVGAKSKGDLKKAANETRRQVLKE